MKVKNQNLKLTQATNEPRIKRKQMDQIQKIKNIIIAQWTHSSNIWTHNQSSFFLRLLARSKPRWQFSVKRSTLHCVGSSFGEQVALDRSEWFLGVRVFWSKWEWVFYIICVKSNGEGRGGLRHSNGGNHRWVKCQNLNHR